MAFEISVLGWDHPRCTRPLAAARAAWEARTGGTVKLALRTLEQFGDQPIEDAAGECDVLVYDHPHVAEAAGTGALVPLEDLLSAEALDLHAGDAVGACHWSYQYAGRQWGLAADAACHVTAYRADRLEAPPATWDEVLALAERQPGAVALPGHPTHVLCAYLTLCANRGGDWRDPAAGVPAVELLRTLHALAGRPRSEPPALLHDLTRREGLLALVPIVFGYVTYAVSGPEVEVPCTFCDLPSAGHGPSGALLGGAGLGVSSTSPHPAAAAAFASWFCSAEIQRTVVAPAGGQPATRECWRDGPTNRSWNTFYAGTLATMEAARMRPRNPGWPGFQRAAGHHLAASLGGGEPAAGVVAGLAELAARCQLDREP
ncbi:MAG: extracellular solute-binding protein [Gaiellales bacterium]